MSKNRKASSLRYPLLTLLLLMLVLSISSPAAMAAITLDVMVVANNATEREAFTEAFRLYEKENPGITIQEAFTDAGTFQTKLLAMTAGGVQPDAMWLWGIHFRNLAPKGFLLPLDDHVDKAFLNAYFPNAIDTSRYQGTLYALPGLVGTMAIMANLDMFANAGVELVNYRDDWDSFLAKTKKLTRTGPTVQFGFTWYAKTVRDWTTWLWRNEGDLFDASLTKLAFNTPESLEALQYLSDLTNVHYVTPPGNTLVGAPWNDFYNEKAAMYPNGSWSLGALNNVKFTIDIVPYPVHKNQTATMDTFFMGVHAQAKHPEEAIALAKWLTHSEAGQAQLYATKFGIPSIRKEAIRYFIETKHPWRLDIFLNALNIDQARALPYVANWADIEALLVKEFTPVWSGQKPVKTVVDEITPRVNALLQ
ncbi:MAG: ABC transporter substrate-binding protein [Limnochordia bacterium]|jgi:multiple sugar transport system substrate-binding protein